MLRWTSSKRGVLLGGFVRHAAGALPVWADAPARKRPMPMTPSYGDGGVAVTAESAWTSPAPTASHSVPLQSASHAMGTKPS